MDTAVANAVSGVGKLVGTIARLLCSARAAVASPDLMAPDVLRSPGRHARAVVPAQCLDRAGGGPAPVRCTLVGMEQHNRKRGEKERETET